MLGGKCFGEAGWVSWACWIRTSLLIGWAGQLAGRLVEWASWVGVVVSGSDAVPTRCVVRKHYFPRGRGRKKASWWSQPIPPWNNYPHGPSSQQSHQFWIFCFLHLPPSAGREPPTNDARKPLLWKTTKTCRKKKRKILGRTRENCLE